MTDTEPMLDIPEVCRRLSVHETTVRRWLKSGVLRGSRLGGRIWRVSAAEVERFVKQGELPEVSDIANLDARR